MNMIDTLRKNYEVKYQDSQLKLQYFYQSYTN